MINYLSKIYYLLKNMMGSRYTYAMVDFYSENEHESGFSPKP